ncbi:hypothetical protein FRC11_005417, partial [Ceratobasidium sp. 423]
MSGTIPEEGHPWATTSAHLPPRLSAGPSGFSGLLPHRAAHTVHIPIATGLSSTFRGLFRVTKRRTPKGAVPGPIEITNAPSSTFPTGASAISLPIPPLSYDPRPRQDSGYASDIEDEDDSIDIASAPEMKESEEAAAPSLPRTSAETTRFSSMVHTKPSEMPLARTPTDTTPPTRSNSTAMSPLRPCMITSLPSHQHLVVTDASGRHHPTVDAVPVHRDRQEPSVHPSTETGLERGGGASRRLSSSDGEAGDLFEDEDEEELADMVFTPRQPGFIQETVRRISSVGEFIQPVSTAPLPQEREQRHRTPAGAHINISVFASSAEIDAQGCEGSGECGDLLVRADPLSRLESPVTSLYQPQVFHDRTLIPPPLLDSVNNTPDEDKYPTQPDLANFPATDLKEIATLVHEAARQCQKPRPSGTVPLPASLKSSPSICSLGYSICPQVPNVDGLSIGSSSSPTTSQLPPLRGPTTNKTSLALARACKLLSPVTSTESLSPTVLSPSPQKLIVQLGKDHQSEGTCQTVHGSWFQGHKTNSAQLLPGALSSARSPILAGELLSVAPEPHLLRIESPEIGHLIARDRRHPGLHPTDFYWAWIGGLNSPLFRGLIQHYSGFVLPTKVINVPFQCAPFMVVGPLGYSYESAKYPRSAILGDNQDIALTLSPRGSETTKVVNGLPIIPYKVERRPTAPWTIRTGHLPVERRITVVDEGQLEKPGLESPGQVKIFEPSEARDPSGHTREGSLGGACRVGWKPTSEGSRHGRVRTSAKRQRQGYHIMTFSSRQPPNTPTPIRQDFMGSPPSRRCRPALCRPCRPNRSEFKPCLAPRFRPFYTILSLGSPNTKRCSGGFDWEPGGLGDSLDPFGFCGLGFLDNPGSMNEAAFWSGRGLGLELPQGVEVNGDPLQVFFDTIESRSNIPAPQPQYHDGGDSTMQQPANAPPTPVPLSTNSQSNAHGPEFLAGFVAGCEFVTRPPGASLSRPQDCGPEWNKGFFTGCTLASRTSRGNQPGASGSQATPTGLSTQV